MSNKNKIILLLLFNLACTYNENVYIENKNSYKLDTNTTKIINKNESNDSVLYALDLPFEATDYFKKELECDSDYIVFVYMRRIKGVELEILPSYINYDNSLKNKLFDLSDNVPYVINIRLKYILLTSAYGGLYTCTNKIQKYIKLSSGKLIPIVKYENITIKTLGLPVLGGDGLYLLIDSTGKVIRKSGYQ